MFRDKGALKQHFNNRTWSEMGPRTKMQHASTHVKLSQCIRKTSTNSRTWFPTKKTDTAERIKNMHCQKRMKKVRRKCRFCFGTYAKNKNVEIALRCKLVLAGTKTHVRQTKGIAVRKRTPRHNQIQVRNSTFKIDFSLREKRGDIWG